MPIGYQQHTNSEELNAELKKNFEAVTILTKELGQLEKDLLVTKVINNVNLEFIKRDFNALIIKNQQLQREIDNSGTFNKKIFISPPELTLCDLYGYIDPRYNITSFLPSKTIPISHVDTSKGKYIPDDLVIEITDDFEEYMYVETDRKNILTGSLNNPWYREYHIDGKSPIEQISLSVTINMPHNSINSYIYNNLVMTPFPFNNLNVDLIEVYANDSWHRVDGGLKNSRHIFIQNKLESIDKLRITVTQNKYLLINSEKIFYIGISDLQISQIKTEADKVCFSYDYTSSENIIINSVEALIDNQFIKNDKEYFEYEIFLVDTDTGYTTPIEKYNHIYIAYGDTIRFLFYLYKQDIIPVLRQITINFSRNI